MFTRPVRCEKFIQFGEGGSLRGLVNHPNAAGVLVLGLGRKNNNIREFLKVLGTWDADRVRFGCTKGNQCKNVHC